MILSLPASTDLSGLVAEVRGMGEPFSRLPPFPVVAVNEEYAEMAVGHARAELVAIYNRDDGREIMASIFERWAEHIEKLLAKENAKLAATSGKGVFA